MSQERKIVFDTSGTPRLYIGPEILPNVKRKMNAVGPGLDVRAIKSEFQKKLEEEEDQNNNGNNPSQNQEKPKENDSEKPSVNLEELENKGFVVYNKKRSLIKKELGVHVNLKI